MIDRSGEWWRGEDFANLEEYLREYSAREYPVTRIVQSRCQKCDGAVFGLLIDPDEGVAKRICMRCAAIAFIGDSEENRDDAEPSVATCPCDASEFETGVGFALRDGGDVRWVYVACRCVACGVLGVYADWKIDYSPTDHLFAAV